MDQYPSVAGAYRSPVRDGAGETCEGARRGAKGYALPMFRYFFDINDGELSTTDLDGLELDGPEAARVEAVRALSEIARDALREGHARTLTATVRTPGEAILRASLTLECEWLA
jgi:hypothetical protein